MLRGDQCRRKREEEETDEAEVQPGTKLSTLDEVFDFVQCATDEPVLFNIESKINPVERNQTRSAAKFVDAMGKIFVGRGEDVVERITHQSFDVSSFISLSHSSSKSTSPMSSEMIYVSKVMMMSCKREADE